MTDGSKAQVVREPVELLGRRVPGLYLRTTSTGRQVYEYRGRLNGRFVNRTLAARSKTDAAAEVEQLRADARSSDRPVTLDRQLTVAQLTELFLKAADSDPGYSERTRADLRARLDKHIAPALGSARVCELDAFAVRRFARSLPQTMRAKSHRNIVSVLSVLLSWAVAEGYAAENPVTRAKDRFPKDMRRRDRVRFEPRMLTDHEAALALAAVTETYRPVVRFIAETGARVSEALAVRFGDVDLQAGTWTIAGQLAEKPDGDGNPRVVPCKTPGSMVAVPLSPAAVAIVRERRQQLMRDCGFHAVAADAFVFTGRGGNPFGRRNTLRAWQDAAEKTLGFEPRPHELRGTFISRLVERNVDAPTVQALARHARLTTTLDIYTRVRGDKEARLERMRDALNA